MCPVAGYYMFTATISSAANANSIQGLVLDGEELTSDHSDGNCMYLIS